MFELLIVPLYFEEILRARFDSFFKQKSCSFFRNFTLRKNGACDGLVQPLTQGWATLLALRATLETSKVSAGQNMYSKAKNLGF